MILKGYMRLYHGTCSNFNSINLNKARPYKDFGKGFYLTSYKDQALKWAKRSAKAVGKQRTAYIYCYGFKNNIAPPTNALNVLELLTYDKVWLDFICANRLENKDSDYDVVYDRIADNINKEISDAIAAYSNDQIDANQAIQKLKWKKDEGDQYCFKTKNAISYLQLIKKIQIQI